MTNLKCSVTHGYNRVTVTGPQRKKVSCGGNLELSSGLFVSELKVALPGIDHEFPGLKLCSLVKRGFFLGGSRKMLRMPLDVTGKLTSLV